jgi:hypothetical protein
MSEGNKETPQELLERMNVYWEYDTDHMISSAYDCIVDLRQIATEQAAEIARLRAALVKSCEEIDNYIRQEYPIDHPVHERYRRRDFESNPARIALGAKT